MTRRVRFSPLLVAGVFVASLGARPAHASDVPFSSPPPISTTEDGPWSAAVADVDGDGDLDVVSTSRYDGRVDWYENSGGAGQSWILHTVSTALAFGFWVATADLDGDGDVDILTASAYDDTVAWHENTAGNGTAWTLHTITTSAPFAQFVSAADMDGDGDLDVLASSYFDHRAAWFENTAGDGSSWVGHTIAISAVGSPRELAAADVDGDGDLDVLSAAAEENTVAWHENTNGAGTAWVPHVIDTALIRPTSVAAADMDGDGDMDAVSASNLGGQVVWYENLGAGGGWSTHAVSDVGFSIDSVLAADVDGDGDVDVLSQGGVLGAVIWHENIAGNGSAWTERAVTTAAYAVLSLAAADLDGDGDVDVVAAAPVDDKVSWYRNDTIHASACFAAPSPVSTSAAGTRVLAPADVDGDGTLDLIAASVFPGQTLSWYRNGMGDGSVWDAVPVASNPSNQGPISAVPFDVDGDGDQDIVSSVESGLIRWHENVGDGFVWSTHIVAGGGLAASIDVSDVDGDGDGDVLVAGDILGVQWIENSAGDGSSWGLRTIYVDPTFTGAESVVAADVDGDGDRDAVSGWAGAVRWHENVVGDGTFWLTATIAKLDPLATVRALAASDVDRDGDVDAVAALDFYGGPGSIVWFENTAGNGSAWTPRTIATDVTTPLRVSVSDLDRDGDPDVLSASYGDDKVAWYENADGAGTTWIAHVVSTIPGAAAVVAADVDGDGATDLASAASTAGEVAWHANRGGQAAISALDISPPTANNGDVVAMLRIDVTHAGRAGDHDLELFSMGLLFEEAAGDPLTDLEANALLQSLRIYRDANGDGIFEPGTDTLVVDVPMSLLDGIDTVVFGSNPDVRVSFGAPATFFVVVQLTADASQQDPNSFRITHLGLGPSATAAEDATVPIPLRLACPSDTSTQVMGTVVPVDLTGFSVE